MFSLSKFSDTKVTAGGLQELKTFEKLAAEHKTPSKPPKLERDIDSFEAHHNWRTWEKNVLSGKTSLDLSGSSFSQSVERQFNVFEKGGQGCNQ